MVALVAVRLLRTIKKNCDTKIKWKPETTDERNFSDAGLILSPRITQFSGKSFLYECRSVNSVDLPIV